MHRRTFIAGLAITALVLTTLHAAGIPYLTPNAVDPLTLLAPPPSPGSAEDRVDLDTSYRVYAAASPTEHAKGLDEVTLTIFHFAPAIGPWFQASKFPKTEALFHEVEAEAKAIAKVGKNHWQRIRPYHVDPAKFRDPIEHEPRTDYAYPSGHSTRGTLYAALLGELFPDKREALFLIGREAGWLRVQGGVHYPTDIYAGRVLGQAIARELLHNERFQHDLAEARIELSAAPH
jgi:acid phosphatase (class A)